MAKVTARGDEPAQIWTGPNGRKMVLTRKGRLLMRYAGSRRYTVLRTQCRHEEAERLAVAQMLTAMEVYS